MDKNERLTKINFQGILYNLEKALNEFSGIVDEEYKEIKIKGLYVVGTSLNNNFKKGKSDLDLYIILNKEYENSDGFINYISDKNSYYYDNISKNVPDQFSNIDFIDTVTQERASSVIRDPYIKIENN